MAWLHKMVNNLHFFLMKKELAVSGTKLAHPKLALRIAFLGPMLSHKTCPKAALLAPLQVQLLTKILRLVPFFKPEQWPGARPLDLLPG